NGQIRFVKLIPVMFDKFKKIYSENKLKNFWKSRERKGGLRIKTKRQGEVTNLNFDDEKPKTTAPSITFLNSSRKVSDYSSESSIPHVLPLIYTHDSPLRNQAPSEFRQIHLPIDTHNSPSKNQAPSIIRPVPQHALPPIDKVLRPIPQRLSPLLPPVIHLMEAPIDSKIDLYLRKQTSNFTLL
ncbi:13008_t:CDS:1, partial [Funneliformis geosporum]